MIGLETDALVDRGLVIRHRVRHQEKLRIVLDAPEARDYWHGHGFVLESRPQPAELDALIVEGRERFGPRGVARFVITWESLQPSREAIDAPPGTILERTVAMKYFGAAVERDARVVDLEGTQAWSDAAVLISLEYAEQADFTIRRLDDLRRLVRAENARAVGIAEAGRIVAMAAIAYDRHRARFVLPLTHPAARRRGYFSACARTLIHGAAGSDLRRDVVIVVDPVAGPEPLYRRLGFLPVSHIEALVVTIER